MISNKGEILIGPLTDPRPAAFERGGALSAAPTPSKNSCYSYFLSFGVATVPAA
jgi:hypothetical protein